MLKLNSHFKALFLAILFMSGCYNVLAMDVVTLTDGKVLRGEIYHKDEDGSLYMNLPNGTKRYIMPDEIQKITSDDVPFQYGKNSTAKSDSESAINVSVYAGYEQMMPTKASLNLNEDKFQLEKSSPGFVIGADIKAPIINNFVFQPGLEIALAKTKYNKSCFEYYNLGPNYHFPHYGYEKLNICARIPIQIGYEYIFNKKLGISLLTGPIWGCSIFEISGAEFYDRSVAFSRRDTGVTEVSSDYRRFSVDWRITAKINFNKFFIRFAYSIGLTNRLNIQDCHRIIEDDEYGYSCYEVNAANLKMRTNSLQISVGMNF